MKFSLSRKLRKNQTPWEAKLWQILRNRELENLKFRRQYKISRYVADFCCLNKRLVIELDGGHHNETSVNANDVERQKYIESQGYKVLRFWNNEVDNNTDGLVDKILESCKK